MQKNIVEIIQKNPNAWNEYLTRKKETGFIEDLKIMEDILKGVKKDNYEVIHNRREAIKKGLMLLKDNDTLLILGKGHEDYQIIGTEKVHLSDKEEVLKYKEETNL